MKVKIEITVETEDFGSQEFEKEIACLIADIDPKTKILDFKMYEQV